MNLKNVLNKLRSADSSSENFPNEKSKETSENQKIKYDDFGMPISEDNLPQA